MVLSLTDLNQYLNWNGAKIRYFQMVGDTIHMDVDFVTFKQGKYCRFSTKYVDIRIHLIFLGVNSFTDAYFSPLDKLLSRFTNTYTCESNSINEKGEFVIDDCICINCREVDVIELPH